MFLPPRVCSSVLKTIFNGWCSHRRFHNRGAVTNRCRFGCGGAAEDSIEHYCKCPATLEVLEKMLKVTVNPKGAIAFWSMDFPSNWDTLLKCCALSIYAAYRTFNIYRCKGYNATTPVAIDAMRESIIQACRGSKELGDFLDDRWNAGHLSF